MADQNPKKVTWKIVVASVIGVAIFWAMILSRLEDHFGIFSGCGPSCKQAKTQAERKRDQEWLNSLPPDLRDAVMDYRGKEAEELFRDDLYVLP